MGCDVSNATWRKIVLIICVLAAATMRQVALHTAKGAVTFTEHRAEIGLAEYYAQSPGSQGLMFAAENKTNLNAPPADGIGAKTIMSPKPGTPCMSACQNASSNECETCCRTTKHEIDWGCDAQSTGAQRADCCEGEWDASCWDTAQPANHQHACNQCGPPPIITDWQLDYTTTVRIDGLSQSSVKMVPKKNINWEQYLQPYRSAALAGDFGAREAFHNVCSDCIGCNKDRKLKDKTQTRKSETTFLGTKMILIDGMINDLADVVNTKDAKAEIAENLCGSIAAGMWAASNYVDTSSYAILFVPNRIENNNDRIACIVALTEDDKDIVTKRTRNKDTLDFKVTQKKAHFEGIDNSALHNAEREMPICELAPAAYGALKFLQERSDGGNLGAEKQFALMELTRMCYVAGGFTNSLPFLADANPYAVRNNASDSTKSMAVCKNFFETVNTFEASDPWGIRELRGGPGYLNPEVQAVYTGSLAVNVDPDAQGLGFLVDSVKTEQEHGPNESWDEMETVCERDPATHRKQRCQFALDVPKAVLPHFAKFDASTDMVSIVPKENPSFFTSVTGTFSAYCHGNRFQFDHTTDRTITVSNVNIDDWTNCDFCLWDVARNNNDNSLTTEDDIVLDKTDSAKCGVTVTMSSDDDYAILQPDSSFSSASWDPAFGFFWDGLEFTVSSGSDDASFTLTNERQIVAGLKYVCGMWQYTYGDGTDIVFTSNDNADDPQCTYKKQNDPPVSVSDPIQNLAEDDDDPFDFMCSTHPDTWKRIPEPYTVTNNGITVTCASAPGGPCKDSYNSDFYSFLHYDSDGSTTREEVFGASWTGATWTGKFASCVQTSDFAPVVADYTRTVVRNTQHGNNYLFCTIAPQLRDFAQAYDLLQEQTSDTELEFTRFLNDLGLSRMQLYSKEFMIGNQFAIDISRIEGKLCDMGYCGRSGLGEQNMGPWPRQSFRRHWHKPVDVARVVDNFMPVRALQDVCREQLADPSASAEEKQEFVASSDSFYTLMAEQTDGARQLEKLQKNLFDSANSMIKHALRPTMQGHCQDAVAAHALTRDRVSLQAVRQLEDFGFDHKGLRGYFDTLLYTPGQSGFDEDSEADYYEDSYMGPYYSETGWLISKPVELITEQDDDYLVNLQREKLKQPNRLMINPDIYHANAGGQCCKQQHTLSNIGDIFGWAALAVLVVYCVLDARDVFEPKMWAYLLTNGFCLAAAIMAFVQAVNINKFIDKTHKCHAGMGGGSSIQRVDNNGNLLSSSSTTKNTGLVLTYLSAAFFLIPPLVAAVRFITGNFCGQQDLNGDPRSFRDSFREAFRSRNLRNNEMWSRF